MTPDLSFWIGFFGWTSVKIALLLPLALVGAYLARTASNRKGIWKSAITLSVLILLSEVIGVESTISEIARTHQTSQPTQKEWKVEYRKSQPAPVIEPVIAMPKEPVPTVTPVKQEKSILWWPLWIWAGGSCLLLVRYLFAQVVMLNVKRGIRPIHDSALRQRVQEISQHLGIGKRVRLFESDKLPGPFTFGMRNPAICLPGDFVTDYTSAQRDAVLAHELAHIAGRDMLWNHLATHAKALLWWHPAVWFVSNRLSSAAEQAADEASLLISDGPTALAESLVSLGRKLSGSFSPMLLGMEGSGLRSGLAKRVERLLKMENRKFEKPGYKAMAYAVVFGMMIMVAITLFAALIPRSNAGETNRNGSLLDMAVAGLMNGENEKDTPGNAEANKTNPTARIPDVSLEVEILVQEASNLYEDGKWDEADVKLKKAIALDPQNQAAEYYLKLVAESLAAKPHPINERLTQKGPLALLRNKLNDIILDEVGFDNVRLAEVVKVLMDKAKKFDPEQKGVKIIMADTPAEVADMKESVQLSEIKIRIDPPLINARLMDALGHVTIGSHPKVRLSVETNGVVFSRYFGELPPLYSRVYKIDKKKLLKYVGNVDQVLFSPHTSQNAFGTSNSGVGDAFFKFFAKAGVKLDPPKAFFFNNRTSSLMVRASLKDWNMLQSALTGITAAPRQILIEVQICKVRLIDGKTADPEKLLGVSLTNDSGPRVLKGNDSYPATPTGILNNEQFKQLIIRLKTMNGLELVNAPKITTLEERQVQVKTVEIKPIITGYNTNYIPVYQNIIKGKMEDADSVYTMEKFEFGSSVDITPSIQLETNIYLSVTPTIKEFSGYHSGGPRPGVRDLSDWVGTAGASRGASAPKLTPTPQFVIRQTTVNTVVPDGHTLVISSDSCIVETGIGEEKATTFDPPDKAGLMLVFVTPTLIDVAGNPVYQKK